uniref:uncharacterized protein LOC122593874 n=1 Tax=Erigeron canadensis TaxID=72917 RepID=UPI001CB8D0ED|nr:uncharacterized protein LOC122593874 [Erigeron canadensis]
MDEFDTEKSNHVNLKGTPSHEENEGMWKTYGMSISLGFVATAVLISMFLIIAILEQLFKPNASFRFTQRSIQRLHEPRSIHKLIDAQPSHVQMENESDISVLMPGDKYPTYIAHPTPLPCSREGVYWPSHSQHDLVHNIS